MLAPRHRACVTVLDQASLQLCTCSRYYQSERSDLPPDLSPDVIAHSPPRAAGGHGHVERCHRRDRVTSVPFRAFP